MTIQSTKNATLRPSNGKAGQPVQEPARSGNQGSSPANAPASSVGSQGTRLYITRYGKSIKAGGWDGVGDSGTDKGYGCFDKEDHPTLAEGDCALTVEGQADLGAKPHAIIRLWFDNDPREFLLRFNDRAPQQSKNPDAPFYTKNSKRLDIYLPWKDDKSIPEWGYARVVMG